MRSLLVGLLCAFAILLGLISGAWAGVPCAATSSVWTETDTVCVGDTIEVYVIVRDCYGDPMLDRTCTFFSDRDCADKLMHRNPKSDENGYAYAYIRTFSPGESQVYVVCDGVVLGPADPITWIGSAPFLRAGPWVIGEPWRNWIGGPGDTTQLELHICDTSGDVDSVAFYYDTGGGDSYISTDLDGSAGHPNDGWSAYFEHDLVAQVDQPISFKAEVYHSDICTMEYTVDKVYDPTPPSDVTFNIADWDTVVQETLHIDITPNGVDIDSVMIDVVAMADTFQKNIPLLDPSTAVFPERCYSAMATAACFKWFETERGDTDLTGGMDDSTLVDRLCHYYFNGCTVLTADDPQQFPRWVLGIRQWIEDYSDIYTIQDYEHVLPYDGYPWDYNFWRYARGELEEYENVLMAFRWPGIGWRAMTWNSLVSDSVPGGRYLCDWYDPASNAYESGEVDPFAGTVHSFTGPLGDTPEIYKTIVISPKWYDWKNPPDGEHKVVTDYTGGPIGIGLPYPEGPNTWWLVRVVVKDAAGNAHVAKFIIIWVPESGVEDRTGGLPREFSLSQNTPNPFSVHTEMRYALSADAEVSLDIYDVRGKKVRTLVSGRVEAGYHTAVWNGTDDRKMPVAPGIYYARMVTSGYTGTSKLIYLK